MRILHLVAGELGGGAAKGALNLHKALLDYGIDSHILTTARDTLNDSTISNINKYKAFFYAKLDSGISRICGSERIFSNNLYGASISQNPLYQTADIIHLHWVNNGFISLRQIASIKKPIVWSVRDMWALSGGCHYAIAGDNLCFKYKHNCSHCPQLKPKIKLFSNLALVNQWLKKHLYPSNLHFVGISSFISECLKSSIITRDFPIHTILNCINLDEFYCVNKAIARQILRIHTDKKILLCGANKLDDFYKGFDFYLKALNFLPKDRYFLCFFGQIDERQIPQGFEFKSFGYHNSTIALSLIYSLADIFIAPSLLDAAPKTIMESLACGTPAVAFDNSGAKDIIEHKTSGYLAKAFEAKDLARGIEWIANANLSHNAKQNAYKFSAKNIARKYIDLYAKIAESSGGDSANIARITKDSAILSDSAKIANGGGHNVESGVESGIESSIKQTAKPHKLHYISTKQSAKPKHYASVKNAA